MPLPLSQEKPYHPPAKDCIKCERLCAFRADNRRAYPTFYNGAVASFGALDAKILIVGLAPGLKGANKTGRPFTGDFAGDILYAALARHGLASGDYLKHQEDGLTLHRVRITNAVRCVPPENKPIPQEIAACNLYLYEEIMAMPQLNLILSLGNVSHQAVLKALHHKASAYKFSHGALHRLSSNAKGEIMLLNSYHTSRYNIQTRRLNTEMFDAIIARCKTEITAV